MATYILCLDLAADCCMYCSKSSDKSFKAAWQEKMFGHIEKVKFDGKCSCDIRKKDLKKICEILPNVEDVCQKCNGTEALVQSIIIREWIRPNAVYILSPPCEKKEKPRRGKDYVKKKKRRKRREWKYMNMK